jgi:hypothetical protein
VVFTKILGKKIVLGINVLNNILREKEKGSNVSKTISLG